MDYKEINLLISKLPLVKRAYEAWTKSLIEEYPFQKHTVRILAEVGSKKRIGKAKMQFLQDHRCDIGDDESYLDVRVQRCRQSDIILFEGDFITKESAFSRLLERDRKEKTKEFVEKNKGKQVYIYSGQWGAYWRTNNRGYTDQRDEAGIYDIEKAWDLISCNGPEKLTELRLVAQVDRNVLVTKII